MKETLFLTFVIGIGMLIGFCFGMGFSEQLYHKRAIEHKAAHYEMNALTGETTWKWNQ